MKNLKLSKRERKKIVMVHDYERGLGRELVGGGAGRKCITLHIAKQEMA